MTALVSIGIPMYNAAKTIARCLQSCLALDWAALEIVVVDNGSLDDCTSIVDAIAARARCPIRRIACSERGPGPARNAATPHLNGEYVAWVDADDLVFADKIRTQIDALRRFGDAPAIASSEVLVERSLEGSNPQLVDTFTLLPCSAERTQSLLGFRGVPPAGYLLTRAAVQHLDETGGFLPVRCQDREYFARAHLLGIPFVHVERATAVYCNWSPVQVTNALSRALWAPALDRCYSSLRSIREKYDISLSPEETAALSRSWEYHAWLDFKWTSPDEIAFLSKGEMVRRNLDPLERAILLASGSQRVVFAELLAASTIAILPMLAPAASRVFVAAHRLLENGPLVPIDHGKAEELATHSASRA